MMFIARRLLYPQLNAFAIAPANPKDTKVAAASFPSALNAALEGLSLGD
jgi:hypothetical protein